MHMNVGTYIHAKLFNSTTAAAELAERKPKYSQFASNLIRTKNESNKLALSDANKVHEDVKLNRNEWREILDIRRGSNGSSAGASKGVAHLAGRYTDHINSFNEKCRLQQKEFKYLMLLNQIRQPASPQVG
jgi:hypothetical protein